MWSTLTGEPELSSAKKCLLAITALSNVFANAIGHQTTFVDPGPHGDHCDTAMIRELKRTIEDQDPSLVYIHVPFVNDNEDTDGYRTLKSFANDQMKTGRTLLLWTLGTQADGLKTTLLSLGEISLSNATTKESAVNSLNGQGSETTATRVAQMTSRKRNSLMFLQDSRNHTIWTSVWTQLSLEPTKPQPRQIHVSSMPSTLQRMRHSRTPKEFTMTNKICSKRSHCREIQSLNNSAENYGCPYLVGQES